jgi:hypothetical protein
MSQKSNVDLVVLQSDLYVLVVLQIELMDDYLLYSKFVVTLIVLLLIAIHLLGDLLMSTPMTTTLM